MSSPCYSSNVSWVVCRTDGSSFIENTKSKNCQFLKKNYNKIIAGLFLKNLEK
jgi:hypothetical protein